MTPDNTDTESRFRRLESSTRSVPLYQRSRDYDRRVPSVISPVIVTTTAASGVVTSVIKWLSPSDPTIDRFEIWITRSDNPSQNLVLSTKDSPARVSISASTGTKVVCSIRTVLKNGLSIPLSACPTVIFVCP